VKSFQANNAMASAAQGVRGGKVRFGACPFASIVTLMVTVVELNFKFQISNSNRVEFQIEFQQGLWWPAHTVHVYTGRFNVQNVQWWLAFIVSVHLL